MTKRGLAFEASPLLCFMPHFNEPFANWPEMAIVITPSKTRPDKKRGKREELP
jgi:hypothetical protein